MSDPRKLRPTELCRLLNSTPLGEVVNERQLHRHRTRAGLQIGDARHVDLLRYVAWLVQDRHSPKPEADGDPYEKMKERARARNVALADDRGLRCRDCGCRRFYVIYTRPYRGGRLVRRRECRNCGKPITAWEHVIGHN